MLTAHSRENAERLSSIKFVRWTKRASFENSESFRQMFSTRCWWHFRKCSPSEGDTLCIGVCAKWGLVRIAGVTRRDDSEYLMIFCDLADLAEWICRQQSPAKVENRCWRGYRWRAVLCGVKMRSYYKRDTCVRIYVHSLISGLLRSC